MVGEFSLEVRTGTPKVQFWTQGSSIANGEMEVSNVEIHPLPVVASGSGRTGNFNDTFDSGTDRYGWTGNNAAGYWVVKDGVMTGYNASDGTADTTKVFNIQPNQDFVFDVRFKVTDFGGTRGIQWFWEKHGIAMRIYKDYLTFDSADGSVVSDPIDITDKDWHDLKIDAYNYGSRAKVYLDGVAVADFRIGSDTRPSFHIYAYVIGAGGNPCSLVFDSMKYTEKPCQVKVWQPYEGAIYREGQDIVLSASPNVTGEVPSLDYKINGKTVATGTKANNYKATLSHLPVGAYTLTAEYGSYVSGKINFKVIADVSGELETEKQKNGDVLVSLPVTNQGISQVAKVVYQLDGNVVAESEKYPYSAKINDLTPGSHRLVATCYNQTGIALSKFSMDLLAELSEETETSGHFANEVSYDIAGGSGVAELNLRNGNHQLWLQHTPSEIFYHTDTGVEKYAVSGTGSYTILTDGPVADVYRNGQFLLSFYMPQAEINKRCFYENGLTIQNYQISVPAEKKSYLVKRNVAEKNELYNIADIPYYYNLDFVAKKGDAVRLAVNDGYYHNDITLKNGKFYAWVTDQNRSEPYQTELCSLVDTEENVYYRAEVSAGLCRLYGNGRWLTSYRIMHTSGKDSVKVEVTGGEGLKYLAVSDNKDLHLFYDTFNKKGELSSVNFWQSKKMSIYDYGIGGLIFDASSKDDAIVELNAMPGNAEFSAKVQLEYGNGGFWLLLNHSVTNTYTKVGYNFESQQYEAVDVVETFNANNQKEIIKTTLATKTGSFPFNQEVAMGFRAEKTEDGKNLSFYVGEEEIFSLDSVPERYGNIGFIMSKVSGQINEVSYRGDAKVVYGVQNDPGHTSSGTDLFEIGNKLVMTADSGNRAVSTNGGKTWSQEARKEGDSSSIETLSTGEIIGIRREKVGTNAEGLAIYSDVCYISTDQGNSWTRQSVVQPTGLPYRITMPNRVTQGESGRIYFASCENNDESYGYTVVYYSDDKGKTWKATQTVMDAMETGFCIQEVVCLETENNEVRAYFRNDLGYIHYFISKDRGVTWDLTPRKTPFYSAMNCFNVQRDPYDTTGKTLFAAWRYDNPNLQATPQYPRTRWAIARSTDGGENWEYIGTVHENSDMGFAMMNLSINVGKDYVVLSAMSRDDLIPGSSGFAWYQRKVTLPKNQKGSKRFDQVHTMNHSSILSAQMLPDVKAERMMLVHPASETAMVQGNRIENASYTGYVALDCAAAFVGATVTEGSGGAMILTCGSSATTIPVSAIAVKDGKKYVDINTFVSAYNLYVTEMDGVKIISPYNDFSENQKKGIAASINL